MEINPYAAPQAQVLQVTSEAELIRQEHINTEATIKSVGSLYFLITFIFTLVMLSTFTFTRSSLTNGALIGTITVALVFLALGAGLGLVAYGLRRLRSWTRIPTIIISCIGLLLFPMGTLVNTYILVKILGKKGKFVMTPEYQEIIAATPHVKYKTSIAAKVLLAVLLIILLIGLVAAFTPKS